MFTGLVQDVGSVVAVRPGGKSVELQLRTRLCPELGIGDSLAVNGVCLTVTATRGDVAVATAIPETLSRTNLGKLSPGDPVNLEPALRVSDRLGGHIVQGHVDGVGLLTRRRERGISLELTFSAPPTVLRYVVEKGSITIDGVSLTVASRGSDRFSVALVPHTLGATTLQDLALGDPINLEVDVVAKYVERLLQPEPSTPRSSGGINEGWLKERGFG